MTDREKAIVMSYTGYTMLTGDKLGIFYDYVTEKLGRSIMTHELAYDEVADEIKRAATDDFYALCMRDDTAMEAPTVNGWISVKDRLPEPPAKCFVYSRRMREIGIATYTEWGWMTPVYFQEITHWMLLPEPPKGEK